MTTLWSRVCLRKTKQSKGQIVCSRTEGGIPPGQLFYGAGAEWQGPSQCVSDV
jgi:hypothetical protein